MIIIGLTGGIATGKSTVTSLLRKQQVTVIDCDEIAHAVVSKSGSLGLQTNVAGLWPGGAHFNGYGYYCPAWFNLFPQAVTGTKFEHTIGEIDRDKLGALVFGNQHARHKLNRATHFPVAVELLRQILLQWISLTSSVVVDMPLLFETGAHRLMWSNVFVTCDHSIEVARLMKRDRCTEQQAEDKVAAQMPLSVKSAKAHVVIDNSKDLAHLEHQVQKLASKLQQYKWLGALTSPVALVSVLWFALRAVRKLY